MFVFAIHVVDRSCGTTLLPVVLPKTRLAPGATPPLMVKPLLQTDIRFACIRVIRGRISEMEP